jgi:hypothetical protein
MLDLKTLYSIGQLPRHGKNKSWQPLLVCQLLDVVAKQN